MAAKAGVLPNFERLRAGAYTLNARTDPDITVTLPNHLSMITGRPLNGKGGHHWKENSDPEDGQTVHSNRGHYVSSIFDVAHNAGLATGVFATKTKFMLLDRSWDQQHGATSPEEGSRDKIDTYFYSNKQKDVTRELLEFLSKEKSSLTLAHFRAPDSIGHKAGWLLGEKTPYMQAVLEVDRYLGQILDAVENDSKLRNNVALILTSDHGGGGPHKSHWGKHLWVNYIIPFMVWTGGSESLELYELNSETRADPGIKMISLEHDGLPPIRNGDAGNLALSLLGLPAVPDSYWNAKQDLKIKP